MENNEDLNDLIFKISVAKTALDHAEYMHIDTKTTIHARMVSHGREFADIDMLIGTDELKSIFGTFKQSLIDAINIRKQEIINELSEYSVTKK